MNCLKSRERGFTLIELLIVTVVIVTLMGIVFRLAGVGGDSRAKSKTLARLQRVENAISGYYAAYGSYPPVPLQGRSRDISMEVDGNGVQGPKRVSYNLSNPDDETVKQVEAACRAQPVAVLFPFFSSECTDDKNTKDQKLINNLASERNQSFSYTPYKNTGGFNKSTEWHEVSLFQFGLLSFLLPRYQFMLRGDANLYNRKNEDDPDEPSVADQWLANNQRPCRIDTGDLYEWEDMQKALYDPEDDRDTVLVETLPSQAVCARWMPNLEGIIIGGLNFYGVDTSEADRPYLGGAIYNGVPRANAWMHVASQKGFQGTGSLYLLDGMTIADGWGNEFYYHSDAPYQSYRLWSAGPNLRTFPPWVDLDTVEGGNAALKTIANWTKDDISHLAN